MTTMLVLIFLGLFFTCDSRTMKYESERAVLIGSWNATNNTQPANLTNMNCCLPQGGLTFIRNQQNSSFLQMKSMSISWIGNFCSGNENVMTFPYSEENSWDDVDFDNIHFNEEGVGFFLSNLNITDANQTELDLTLLFKGGPLNIYSSCRVSLTSIDI